MADKRKKANLTEIERNNIAQWLLQNSKDFKLRYGAKKEAAAMFNIDVRTVWRLWTAARAQKMMGRPVQLVSMKKGSTHSDKKVIDVEKVKQLSVLERSTIRKMANKLEVSKSLVGVWIKEKKIRAHTNAIKPLLTQQNRLSRLTWSLSQLSAISANGRIKFQPMYNTIHIDEKWFYLTKTSDRYYLLPDEIEPYRACKSKRFIEKIMFIAVVSRPQYDNEGKMIFDGKFGIFPFTTVVPAVRNSKNRMRGTLETKAIQAITKEVSKDVFINQIIPTIKAKWPRGASRHIIIQQDNAKPHIKGSDPDFVAAATSDGFNIQLICQPPNSPDTNVNDLGFFRAIQSLQDDKLANCVDDLLKNVKDAFEELEPHKLNNVFLTLQGCYHEIIKCRGNNNYKIPHINKERLSRLGVLPECLEVEEQLVRDCLEELRQQQTEQGTIYNLDQLVEGLQQVVLND
ncbi:uncharacterized protein LOC131013599 [Salvia miltiorrhiza]|uniref:uncharacterized protein LOC130990584 n=1 Tax=Salvia miltiorrhiza TaxID=226208 RepID=UPI0025AC77DD|nr:uncharacterized protein LOC130990584 [Salvia miltiorrhiza]XP_057797706.1 uncharacterized protein LOC131013599 [Salvia miltiorrhiza]